jgi:hypothetical protein
MRIPTAVVFAAASMIAVMAAEEPAAAPDVAAREAALESMLGERESAQALERAIAAALTHGVSEQAVLEARFLFHVDRQDDEALAALAPEFLKRRDQLDIADSAIFGVREDWLAVTEYVQALAALNKGDRAGFKRHITEAFWLSPRQAAAFAPHIEKLRLDEAMHKVALDLAAIRLAPLAGGEAVALDRLMEGNGAMLIHFWSPWSHEAEMSMPDFIATANELAAKNIAVVSILPLQDPQVVADARDSVRRHAAAASGHWLLDRADEPLGRELRVQSVPVMVLVSNKGRILFNGHPADEMLWRKLAEVDPRIERPASPVADPEGP